MCNIMVVAFKNWSLEKITWIKTKPGTYVEGEVVHVEEGHFGVVLPADEHVWVSPDVGAVQEPGQPQSDEARAPAQRDVCPGLAPDNT